MDKQSRLEKQPLSSYSFFEEPSQPEPREPTVALNQLKCYSVDGLHLVDAVYVKKDVVMVAGLFDSHVCNILSIRGNGKYFSKSKNTQTVIKQVNETRI